MTEIQIGEDQPIIALSGKVLQKAKGSQRLKAKGLIEQLLLPAIPEFQLHPGQQA